MCKVRSDPPTHVAAKKYFSSTITVPVVITRSTPGRFLGKQWVNTQPEAEVPRAFPPLAV